MVCSFAYMTIKQRRPDHSVIPESMAFYTALGLMFQSEQHSAGPKYYCCQLDALALEIYPSEGGNIGGSAVV